MSLTTKEAALAALIENWSPEPAAESIPVENAKGRILAGDMHAKYTLPVVRAAMMDSVALRSADFASGTPDTSRWTRGVEFELADMGDDFDDRYDCAVQVESAVISGDGQLTIAEGTVIKAGGGIKQKGSVVTEGELLLEKGCRLTPCDLAVLATGGYKLVPVIKKPVVAVIPTGSELIPRGAKPKRGQNIEANTVMLAAMLDDMGAEAVCMPIINDDPAKLKAVMDAALKEVDIVVVNGGSSKGDEDFATRMLRGRGNFLFHGVAAGPGRPLSITVVDNKPVLNLPGPPPAAFNAAEWCLKAAVAHFLKQPIIKRHKVKAVLTEAIDAPMQMSFTARLYLTKRCEGVYLATPIQMGRDSLVRTMGADAIYISPVGSGKLEKGAKIEAELLRSEEDIKR
jgi:molybdopterin molybdotransferase/putative molybdopterin biosynthesis protein